MHGFDRADDRPATFGHSAQIKTAAEGAVNGTITRRPEPNSQTAAGTGIAAFSPDATAASIAKTHVLSRTLDSRHALTGPSAAGMLPSSVQGGIHSVSRQGMSAI